MWLRNSPILVELTRVASQGKTRAVQYLLGAFLSGEILVYSCVWTSQVMEKQIWFPHDACTQSNAFFFGVNLHWMPKNLQQPIYNFYSMVLFCQTIIQSQTLGGAVDFKLLKFSNYSNMLYIINFAPIEFWIAISNRCLWCIVFTSVLGGGWKMLRVTNWGTRLKNLYFYPYVKCFSTQFNSLSWNMFIVLRMRKEKNFYKKLLLFLTHFNIEKKYWIYVILLPLLTSINLDFKLSTHWNTNQVAKSADISIIVIYSLSLSNNIYGKRKIENKIHILQWTY